MYVTPTPTGIVLATGNGPGSIFQTTPSCSAVTQTLPPPTASAVGAGVVSRMRLPGRFVRGSIWTTELRTSAKTPASPAATLSATMGTVATTFPVFGSMRAIVWSGSSAQTAPSPIAMFEKPQLGPAPRTPFCRCGRRALCVTTPVLGSTRAMLSVSPEKPPPPLPTHSQPRPAAMSDGRPRVVILPVTASVLGSIREIVRSEALITHTAPSPTAMLLGALPDSMNDATRSPRESIAATPLPTGAVGHSPRPR